MKKIKVLRKLMMLALPVLLLTGCGSGSPAPRGATISINPSAINGDGSNRTTCAYDTDTVVYTSVVATVLSSSGVPIADIDVDYSLDFTTETASPGGLGEAQRIFLGPLSGVFPPPNRLLGAGTLRTDIGGKVKFIIGTDIDCDHTGDFTVQSGLAATKLVIKVAPAAVP